MGSKVKNLLGAAAPLALNYLLPGAGAALGTALGAAPAYAGTVGGSLLGAGIGAATGGGLKGAITGGLTGGGSAGGASLLGGALGATGAAAPALGGALIGAGAGGINSGLKGALLGGAAGGIGGYASGGGFDGLGESFGLTGPGSIFGTPAGSPLPGGVGPTQGTGVLGGVGRAASDIGSALGVGTGGGGSSYGGGNGGISLSSILGGGYDMYSTEKAKKELEKASGQALGMLNPYLQTGGVANQQLSDRLISGFDSSNLADNPAYKFSLEEGQKSLDRANSARGGYYSGAALKQASDYTTNLANNFYKDYYDQWANTNNQFANQAGMGLNAAGGSADIAGTLGSARANATLRNSSNISQLLAGSGSKRLAQLADGTYAYV